jgi:hypothetical protein
LSRAKTISGELLLEEVNEVTQLHLQQGHSFCSDTTLADFPWNLPATLSAETNGVRRMEGQTTSVHHETI